MSRMRPVKLLDAAFLHLETRATPMHVGALFVLAPPPARGNFHARLRRVVAARLGASEVFTRRASTSTTTSDATASPSPADAASSRTAWRGCTSGRWTRRGRCGSCT